jgi:phosphoesterase RecJ-like protein
MSADSSYVSNASIEDLADRLRCASRVAVTTHAKPDGDAIGSTIALARTLMQLGIRATAVYQGPWPKRFDPFVEGVPMVLHEPDQPLPDVDCLAILDTGAWSQLADLRPWIEPQHDNAILLDHHRHGDDVAALKYIDPRASAACEPTAELCRRLLEGETLPRDIAEPLLFGLAMDTGWFKYSSASPAAFRLAADLIEAGADQSSLFRRLEQRYLAPRLELFRRAVNSLELIHDGFAAIMTLTRDDFRETKAHPDDSSNFVDIPQMVGSVRAVCLLTELKPDLTKVSLRSKPADEPGDVEVNVHTLAQEIGGGGHKHASGARIAKPYPEAMPIVVELLRPDR